MTGGSKCWEKRTKGNCRYELMQHNHVKCFPNPWQPSNSAKSHRIRIRTIMVKILCQLDYHLFPRQFMAFIKLTPKSPLTSRNSGTYTVNAPDVLYGIRRLGPSCSHIQLSMWVSLVRDRHFVTCRYTGFNPCLVTVHGAGDLLCKMNFEAETPRHLGRFLLSWAQSVEMRWSWLAFREMIYNCILSSDGQFQGYCRLPGYVVTWQ